LDVLGSLLACAWFDAQAAAEACPTAERIQQVGQIEMRAYLVHRLAARLDRRAA
jgi:hypothetical protein